MRMVSEPLMLTLIYLFMFDSFLQKEGGLMLSSSWRFAMVATYRPMSGYHLSAICRLENVDRPLST